jgi:hypothetical protein
MDNFRERSEALEQQAKAMEAQTRMVERRLRRWRGLACGFLVLGLLTWALPSGRAAYDQGDLERRVAELEYKLEYVSGGSNEVVITGANLRIVNGLGNTETTNGLGNLIVGYNELRLGNDPRPDARTGSHNVVVGIQHNFSSFGGLVVGQRSEISGAFSSVSGGVSNIASGLWASVSGGANNTASNVFSWVSGGTFNTASANGASVSGGQANRATGVRASISGGNSNTASAFSSSVSGGFQRTAPGEFNWAAGPLFADQ